MGREAQIICRFWTNGYQHVEQKFAAKTGLAVLGSPRDYGHGDGCLRKQ